MITNSMQAQYKPLYKTTPNQIAVPNEEREDPFEV